METKQHTPTEKGLSILDSIKTKYFPDGYSSKPTLSGQDYRFSRRGQVEFKRGHQLRITRLQAAGGVL
ncbi:hypothetical protein K1B31_002765 [Vibrio vulnificus]|nr:hypothetical protein [Vibrio vulnificus]EHW0627120.1 hypothetical protein [Vibrio vulnificus]EJB5282235.1 hypothetical protein [Vibrio vulnificus]